MAKLLVTKAGINPSYREIDVDRLIIGRDPECHLKLEGANVSKRHAAIYTLGNDDIVEDLGSTNGTMLNGEVINRHILQDHDVVVIGDYRLEYLNQRAQKEMDFDRTMIASQDILSAALVGSYASRADAPRVDTTRDTGITSQEGALLGLEGAQAGWQIALDKIVVPLARTADGMTPAAILRRPQGFMVMRVARQVVVKVNGEIIGDAWKMLSTDDVIEAGGQRYSFYLK